MKRSRVAWVKCESAACSFTISAMKKFIKMLISRPWSSYLFNKITRPTMKILAADSVSRVSARITHTAWINLTVTYANVHLDTRKTIARWTSMSAKRIDARTIRLVSMELPITRVLARRDGKDGCKFDLVFVYI